MRGRKPKPTALHRLTGTFVPGRHGKRRAGEPVVDGDLAPEPPDGLTATQQACWREAVAHAPRGLLKAIDRGVLVVWTVAYDQHQTATRMQRQLDAAAPALPLLVKGKTGWVKPSPYVRIATRAARTMLAAAAELGFTPAAGARLVAGAPPAEVAGEWADHPLDVEDDE